MRAAYRLSQLQTAAKIRTSTCRPGTLTGLPLRAATAKQLRTGRSNLAAATPICREESLQAALVPNVTHVIEYAEASSNSTASAAKRPKLCQQPGSANRVLDGTGTSITRSINSSTSNVSDSRRIDSNDGSPGSSRRVAHASTSTTAISRSRQLDALESFLGYTFRDITLLEQACTHDLTGDQPSYRELAFVGDAALWLLFAEHAFKAYGSLEDPISGAWPAHLSRLLSRANCAATARQWGLDAYLQHSTPQHRTPDHELGPADSWSPQQPPGFAVDIQLTSAGLMQVWTDGQDACSCSSSSSWGDEGLSRTSSTSSTVSSSSSSSSLKSSTSHRRSGTYAGAWTSDTLAEMFEGVVGALLLDCGYNYETLKQLLLPWVGSSLDASRQVGTAAVVQPAAAAAAAAATETAMQPAYGPSNQGTIPDLQQLQQPQQLQAALMQQLQETCGFNFSSHDPLKSASQHMMQVMASGACSAEADTLKFLGFGILQFTAALQAYHSQHQKGRRNSAADRLWPAQMQEGRWRSDSRVGSTASVAEGNSDSSRSWSSSSSSSAGHSHDAGHRSNVVQQMSEHAGELTTVRHRAKMWLLLLEGTPWCPQDSYLTSSNWKKQKQALARCLDLLLAAVYLDSGLEAAVGVAALLIHTTPPTTHDKSWMPAWARQHSKPVAAVR